MNIWLISECNCFAQILIDFVLKKHVETPKMLLVLPSMLQEVCLTI